METYSGCANYNLYHTCRGCLSLDGTMLDILTPGEREQNLLRIYMGILNSEVSTSDYPFLLCHQCEEKLLQNHAFQNQCQKSYKVIEMYLTDMADRVELNDVVVKEENIITYVVNDNDNSSSCNNNETVTHASEKKDIEFIALDNNMDTDEPNPTKLKDFCEKCNENVQSLSKHQSKFHVNEVLIKSEDTQLCSHCGEIFSSNSLFVEHLQTHINEASSEIDDADLPFICRVCNKLFHGLEALKNHVAIHAGENVEPNSNNERFHRTSDLTSQRPKIKGEKQNIYDYSDCHTLFDDGRQFSAGLDSEHHVPIEQIWTTEGHSSRLQTEESSYKSIKCNSDTENMSSSGEELVGSVIDSDDEYKPEESVIDSDEEHKQESEESCDSWKNNSFDLKLNQVMFQYENTEQYVRKSTKLCKRYTCPFCNTEVLKFGRHVLRRHKLESEVQEILKYKIGDRKRKRLFSKLRNKANFSKSVCDESVVPVRKPPASDPGPPTLLNYLPCKYCKGFYRITSLAKHVKVCPHRDDDKTVRLTARADGQSVFSEYKDDKFLQKQLFRFMKVDVVSLTAKTDSLICALARRYLKKNPNSIRCRTFVTRKMRQLATLLIELKKKIEVGTMLEALDPINYEVIMECSELVAPACTVYMASLIRECIDVACKILVKQNQDTSKLELLKGLFSNRQGDEVSEEDAEMTDYVVEKRNTRILQKWTDVQKELILSFFEYHLEMKIAPKKDECLQLKEQNPDVFVNKSWEKMKIFIVNTYTKGKKD